MRGDSPQCGEMSRSDRGVRPRKRSRAAGEGWLGCYLHLEGHPSVTFGDSSPQGEPFLYLQMKMPADFSAGIVHAINY